jgi:cysteine-rich repeat protein
MDACRDANHFEQDLPSACASNNGQLINICGDGVQANNESCDDHNTNNNDGCSSNCATEAGWTCTGQPSVCKVMFIMKSLSLSAICGDGKVDQGEDCDDNNTTPGDGCSTTCTIESGYTCDKSQTPSVCTPTTANPPLNPNDPNNPNYDPNSKVDKTNQNQGVENPGDAQKDSSGNTMEMSGGGWTCSFHPQEKSEVGASSGMLLALVGLPLLGWVIRKKVSASNK